MTPMTRIASLEHETQEGLYPVFMEAFADYSVPVTWSLADFLESNQRRGLDLSISLGAWDGDDLVGFIMNGRGAWAGRPSAYDLGTGVLPRARGSGLAGELASRLVSFLPGKGLELYVLEVLRDNLAAFKTYEKAGFRITRSLECPAGTWACPAAQAATDVEIVELPSGGAFPRSEAAAFRDWEPSWQNSDDSIARTPGPLVVLGARRDGRLVGHLVASPAGTIWQLAVAREERRKGIGSALLSALAARVGPTIRYINVQADDRATRGLLASGGITEGVGQYEMIREL